MANVNLVALKPTFSRKPGVHFSAPLGYAKVLVKLGVARYEEVETPPVEPERKKRTYRRRDLVADGTEPQRDLRTDDDEGTVRPRHRTDTE